MAFPNQQATVYNDTVVRQFAIMTVVWGVVGMLVGVIIAAQLAWPELNFGIPWLSYGRLPTTWRAFPWQSQATCLHGLPVWAWPAAHCW